MWGTVDEVLEVVNHVPGTVPVLNMAHIHARGHGCMRTSEDYAELFDKVRTRLGEANSTATSREWNIEWGMRSITPR